MENYSEQTLLSHYNAVTPGYSLNYASIEEAQAAINNYKAEIIHAGDSIVEGGESVVFTFK